MYRLLEIIKEEQEKAMTDVQKLIPDLSPDHQKFIQNLLVRLNKCIEEKDLEGVAKVQKEMFKFISKQGK